MVQLWGCLWGGLIGVLGGLIGLGGAEFRLPVLTSIFRFRLLQAIMINLLVSLVTVTFSLLFRTGFSHLSLLMEHATIIINILVGSLSGSYMGAFFATRINERMLRRLVAILLVGLSIILISHDILFQMNRLHLPELVTVALGVVIGFGIGVVSSMLGVAGGELIIPTILILYGQDIRTAGTLSLSISIPTIIVGLLRYYRNKKLAEVTVYTQFMSLMALGSIFGAFVGSQLLAYVSGSLLQIILGCILLISAFKLAREEEHPVVAPAQSKVH